MHDCNSISSVIKPNSFEEENYFSQLNIDNNATTQEIENPVEENCLNEFLYSDESSKECTSLITLNERRLMTAQTMFKKSIKVSIKSFLISLSLSFLNLFI